MDAVTGGIGQALSPSGPPPARWPPRTCSRRSPASSRRTGRPSRTARGRGIRGPTGGASPSRSPGAVATAPPRTASAPSRAPGVGPRPASGPADEREPVAQRGGGRERAGALGRGAGGLRSDDGGPQGRGVDGPARSRGQRRAHRGACCAHPPAAGGGRRGAGVSPGASETFTNRIPVRPRRARVIRSSRGRSSQTGSLPSAGASLIRPVRSLPRSRSSPCPRASPPRT